MPPEVKYIDAVYRRVEAYILPRTNINAVETAQQQAEALVQTSEAIEAYHDALAKFQAVYTQLSSEEVIASFHQGSELLRRNLAGRIARDFSQEYVDTMVLSIRQHEDQIASMFLQVLMRELPELGGSLIADSLESSSPIVRETAAHLVGEWRLDFLGSKLHQLLTDPVPEVARAAKRVLATWK